jgi:outer membrane protein TolC
MIFKHLSVMTVFMAVFFSMMIVLTCRSGAGASDSPEPLPVKYLSLEESLRLARKNSINLQMEEKKLLAARLNTQNVDLEWIPDLIIGASYQYEEINQDNELGRILPFISLSQIVLNDYASYQTKLDAMNNLMAAKVQRETSLRQLYSDIIKKYFELYNGQNQLQLEEQFLKQRLTDFNKAEKRSQDGMISNIELMQNEAMFELAVIEQEVSRNRLEYLEYELISLLNLKTETRIIASDTFSPSFYAIRFAQCKKYAERANLILQLNNQVLKRLPEFRKLVQRTSWPTVSLSGFLGSGATPWDSENRYGLFITASKPLYDFGKTSRKQEILNLELDAIESSIIDFKRKFFLGLKLFFKEFVNAGKTVQQLQKQNELSDKLMKAVRKSYDMGIISHAEMQKRMNTEKERKKEYRAAFSRYLAAEMLLKLNCGVIDLDILLQQGPEWLESEFRDTSGTMESVTEERQ